MKMEELDCKLTGKLPSRVVACQLLEVVWHLLFGAISWTNFLSKEPRCWNGNNFRIDLVFLRPNMAGLIIVLLVLVNDCGTWPTIIGREEFTMGWPLVHKDSQIWLFNHLINAYQTDEIVHINGRVHGPHFTSSELSDWWPVSYPQCGLKYLCLKW